MPLALSCFPLLPFHYFVSSKHYANLCGERPTRRRDKLEKEKTDYEGDSRLHHVLEEKNPFFFLSTQQLRSCQAQLFKEILRSMSWKLKRGRDFHRKKIISINTTYPLLTTFCKAFERHSDTSTRRRGVLMIQFQKSAAHLEKTGASWKIKTCKKRGPRF